ncbi:FecCD family ABC transporter permease [Micromonospora craniellae]|uniref:Iron-enterobactin ABC transporter permease n=1 Tax=Micromonospora craniellae TaxID=2294034 RepID=A0A372FSF3_9ACTN|nr:iron chelate uptake ABC transporter family permease subunit [Micromonospora craniellae]QOC94756.1 iron chelate uptake ABC transporter family permease subunit [Micromonospora craniellae]RFS43554.1 iron-enterobactin ABC transporter permease [Micromonospora craniellae]
MSVAFGYRTRSVRTRWFSGRLSVRLLTVSVLLFLVALALATVALTHGDYPLTIQQVFATFTSEETFERTVVVTWRLPIAIGAVVFGALLGIGGAIFQSLTRNPLGSPDVIGFDAGSYTAVVVAILLVGTGSYWWIAFSAIAGGIATAFGVYVLSYRRGIQSFRLIIVGIGVSAMLGSVNAYLISRAEIEDARTVGWWGAGSITRVSWEALLPALAVAAAIVITAALLAPALRRMELGDDAAVTLGTRPGPARLGLIVAGVATVAVVTAAAGPIGFIALAAPQLARRLTRSAGVSLLASAGMGAALLAGAHLLSLLLAQAYRPVPVGLITVCVGGSYLIWLLISETRKRTGLLR